MICAVSISETESETQLSILCIYHIRIFFHPDFTVGLGISPNHALRLVGYTTGRELHPALKSFDSIVWWNFSGCALQVLETTPASTAKRKAPNTRFRARRRCAKTLAQQKTPERTHSRAVIQHARADTAPCAFCLLSSRLYCRLRNRTESCLAARGLYHR